MLPGKNLGKLNSLKRHIVHSLNRTQIIYTCTLLSFSQSLVIHDSRTEVQRLCKIHDSHVFKTKIHDFYMFCKYDLSSSPPLSEVGLSLHEVFSTLILSDETKWQINNMPFINMFHITSNVFSFHVSQYTG